MSRGDAQDWLEQAHGDLRLAQVGRQDATIPLNLVTFHAQQAVEKAIKALLIQQSVDFPKTHDLQDLLDRLSTSGVPLPADLEEVTALTPYAVQTRYPGFDEPITEAQAAAVLPRRLHAA